MSSFDKVVKLACKPKAAPPKAKYLDPIIAATWSEDGAVHDVCKALSPRFREPNAVVVFKALIVLHTMIRNGATDNVLSYLSSSDVLRLGNVSAGNWEGYAAPQNLQSYSIYLESRIKAYKELKHDAVRVQAESNRDMRTSQSIEEEGYRVKKGVGKHAHSAPPTRSKTIMGRKLRVMTVEKGLLRETRAVHKMIDALVECRFYLDDLEDDLTITALRMLVKDLLILFQAGNEGVINVLEHYFEMSHVDAEQALALYRHFCKQTEAVVEFLGVAKKLQNLLNVPIPNLKHAPVSLAGALQEYLDDGNFEQNRIEYRTNKDAADRNARRGKNDKTPEPKKQPVAPASPPPPGPSSPSTSGSANNAAVADFFSAIEEEQPTMFNPQTNSPSTAYFQQQQTVNPFVQMQMTGQPFMAQPQMQPQITGYPMGQPNPFGLQQQQQAPSHLRPQAGLVGGHRPFTSFIPNEPTGTPQMQGFLQPQMTGANPFRQSALVPQTTGMAMFGVGGPGIQPQHTATPFMNGNNNFGMQNGMPQGQNNFGSAPFAAQPTGFSSNPSSPFPPQQQQQQQTQTINGREVPVRPGSAPLTSLPISNSISPPIAQPIKTHQTGTKNPFGRPMTPPPPIPRQPTLMELAMGMGSPSNGNAMGQGGQQQQQQSQQQSAPTNGFTFSNSSLNPGATDISNVASSFAFNKPSGSEDKPNGTTPSFINSQNTSTTTSSMFSDSVWSSGGISSHQTGATATSSAPSISLTPALKPQTTGFGGMKAFKPTSSFGASLMESLPPIPGSAPGTPALTGNGDTNQQGGQQPNNNAFGQSNGISQSRSQPTFGSGSALGSQPTGFGALNSQNTGFGGGAFGGSSLGQGLRPQMTGGVANPFRASMVNGNTTGGMSMFGNGPNGQQPSMGNNLFGVQGSNSAFSSNFTNGQQQQQQTASLI